jgi:LCP family protein required for cell wall assembly
VKRAFKIIAIILAVTLLGIGGFTLFAWNHINAKIKAAQTPVPDLTTELPGSAMNVLIVGSDARSVIKGSARNERQFRGGTGGRTDTIMLLHIAPKAAHAVLVSFPRDLYVSIPGHGMARLNSAYNKDTYRDGGPGLLIKTVRELTGLAVNHYIEINLSSFQNIVNAIGGVSIYFPQPVSDRESGLAIAHAGCIHLNGSMALSFVRARYIYTTADIGRIQAQQRFIRAVINKAKGDIFDPTKVLGVADAITKGLIIDQRINLGLALGIARRLADQRRIDFRIFPGSFRTNTPYWWPNYPEAKQLFTSLAKDEPLPDVGKTEQSIPAWSDVSINVKDASGKSGWGSGQSRTLSRLGAHVQFGGPAARSPQTTILYAPGAQLKAALLQRRYPYARVVQASGSQSQDLVLLLGSDSVERTAVSHGIASGSPTPSPTATQEQLGQSCG